MASKPQGSLGKWRLGPSECLMAMFRACSRDPTQVIEDSLKCMLHAFMQQHKDSPVLRDVCSREAGIWFYRILECHARDERNRLGTSDIPVIFENKPYLCCLVACCLEITISSNCLPCDISLLLQTLNLAPYHFWKVIELVLRADVGLHNAVFWHLAEVEEKVLKGLAWTRDSPVWEEIQANEGRLPTYLKAMPPHQLEDPKITDLQREGNLAGAGLSLGAEQPGKGKAVHLFARKVYMVMGMRLKELCPSLRISDELRLKIWTCFEYSLVHCTDLMVDRHLDQLLMCAIYIIAKMAHEAIRFKHIMECYESQPFASKNVCENVLICGRDRENSLRDKSDRGDAVLTPNTPSTSSPGPCHEVRGSLRKFYNQVYATEMEQFARMFAPTFEGDTPPLSPYPTLRKASDRRHRVSPSHYIYVTCKTEATPNSKPGLCFDLNSSHAEPLREINNKIKASWSASKRCCRVLLDGEMEDEGEDGRPVKRLHLDHQSAMQRRLRNVVEDRVTTRNQDQPPPAGSNLGLNE